METYCKILHTEGIFDSYRLIHIPGVISVKEGFDGQVFDEVIKPDQKWHNGIEDGLLDVDVSEQLEDRTKIMFDDINNNKKEILVPKNDVIPYSESHVSKDKDGEFILNKQGGCIIDKIITTYQLPVGFKDEGDRFYVWVEDYNDLYHHVYVDKSKVEPVKRGLMPVNVSSREDGNYVISWCCSLRDSFDCAVVPENLIVFLEKD